MNAVSAGLDTTDVAAALLADDGSFVRWNDAFADLTGHVLRAGARPSWHELILPESDPATAVRALEAIASRQIFAGDLLCRRGLGGPFWSDVTLVPAEPGLAGPGQMLALFRDITARRMAEAALGAPETEDRFVLDRVQAGIVVHTASTDIIYANAKATELLGISYDRLLGAGSADPRWGFVDERERPLTVDQFPVSLALATRATVRDLVIGARRPGETQIIWGLCNAYPVLDRHGILTEVVVSFTDITQLKKAELALKESEQRLSLVLEASNDALWDLDLVNRTAYCSARWWEMVGYKTGEQVTSIDTLLSHVHPEDRPALDAQLERWLSSDAAMHDFEYRMVHHSGRSVQVFTRGMIVRDAGGVPIRVVGTNTDVTERRALEARLRQSQKLEAIGQLAGGVAHDFNNLLSVITGNLELAAAEAPASSDPASPLAEALAAARRGAVLTRRLLTFSRQQPLKPDVIDVGHLLTSHGNVLRRLIHESIDVVVEVAPMLPLVEADPGLLESALLNLAINARDAMPGGGTLQLRADVVHPSELTVLTAGELTVQEYVRITVRDTGTGMSRDVAERALEPFFTTKAIGQGTGLGLSMVYGFVRQTGGAMDLRSTLHDGTSVALYFPAAATKAPAPVSGDTTTSSIRPGHDQVILVVEDDPAVRRLCVRSVASLGFRTVEAEHGPAALAVLASGGRVDLVLTDMVMPGGMSGTDLADAVRLSHPEMPVVFMSGYHADMLSDTARKSRQPLLSKPFSLMELEDALTYALTGGARGGPTG